MMVLRRLLRLLSALILFFTVWFLWPRELDSIGVVRDGQASVPDYAMANAHYVSVKAGALEMETRAKEAYFDLEHQRMEARNLISLLYNANGERTIMTADKATYFMNERRLEAKQNVQGLAPDGFLVRSEAAEYFIDRRVLVFPQAVEGETIAKELQVWGDRGESDLDKYILTLTGDARAVLAQDNQKHGETKIRGDSAKIYRAEQKASFFHNVKVNQEDYEGTGDQGNLYFAKDEKGVKYMSLLKDVKITQEKGRYTRSQVAEFFAPSDTIVLSGFPAVYNGDDAVTGDKITMYRTTGVVEVTATNAAATQLRDAKPPAEAEKRPLTKEDLELIP